MNAVVFKQARLRIPRKQKRSVGMQFGALCWRQREGKLQVLLVTSRRSGRWIIPKGWPMDGVTPANAAATEAWEEAGAEGKVGTNCLGIFSYTKRSLGVRDDASCVVAVFPLKVKRLKPDYPEREQRRRKWVSPKKAAKLVSEKELGQIILHFAQQAA